MSGEFDNHQSLGLGISGLTQLASEAQLFKPKQGARHINDSPGSKTLALSNHCQQYLRDLHAILLADSSFQAFISLDDFTSLRQEILDLIVGSAEGLSSSKETQIFQQIDDLIAKMLPELQGSFLGRINFNMRRALRGCWLIFFPAVLLRIRPRRMILAYIDGLWVARNLTCSGFSQAKSRQLLLRIHQKIGKTSEYVFAILRDAIDYNLSDNLVLDGECHVCSDTALESPLGFSVDRDNVLRTFTGPGLYAFGHSLVAYEFLSRLLFETKIAQFHEIRIAPSLVANSALALMLAWRARQSPAQCNCVISDQQLIADTTSQMDSKKCLDDYILLSLLKRDSFQADPIRYLGSLYLDSGLWRWMSRQLSTDLYLHPRPYVCLYLRDDGFKAEGHDGAIHLNSDRNVNAPEYLVIVNELIKYGYDVVRIGDAKQARIECQSDHYYEYLHGEHKSDLNDLYVVSQCEFVVCGGAGGGACIGDIFAKPTLFVDFPITRRGLYSPLGVVIPQLYKKEGTELSVEQILKLTPNGCHDALALQELGISWQPSHRDHVIATLKHFIACVQGSEFYFEASDHWLEMKFDLQGINFPAKVA